MKDARLLWVSAEVARKLQLESRRTGLPISRVIDQLTANDVAKKAKD